jgi:ribosome-associated translation inhibitor RaiA
LIKRAQILFRGTDASAALEVDIAEKIARLERAAPNLESCRVVVESPHRHHTQGRVYRVLVDVTLPGREIVVNSNGAGDPAHEDPYVAVRDVFAAARRRLRDAVVQVREERHAPGAHTRRAEARHAANTA